MRAWLEGSAGTHEEQHCSTHTHVEKCHQLQHCHAQAMGDAEEDPGKMEIQESQAMLRVWVGVEVWWCGA